MFNKYLNIGKMKGIRFQYQSDPIPFQSDIIGPKLRKHCGKIDFSRCDSDNLEGLIDSILILIKSNLKNFIRFIASLDQQGNKKVRIFREG